MMRASLTILGLYNWDPDIFDNIVVPDNINKSILIDTIILNCADFEITIPNADLFARMLYSWSRSQLDNWQRISNALNETYDALYNYDRHEDVTRTWNQTDDKARTDTAGGHDTTTNRTAAFDGDELARAGDSTVAYGGTASANELNKNNGTQTDKIRAYGNIGVTTSQQMLQSEIDLRKNNNIYDIIISEFKKQFCVIVY